MRITDREAKFKELKEQSDSRKYKDEKQKNLLANKVVFMDEGKIVETGTPTEIFKNPKTERLKEFLSKIK